MAWTMPKTWATSELVTAATLNTHVRDNLSYLLNGQPVAQVFTANGYSTTSSVTADIDASVLALTAIPAGTRLLLWFGGALRASGGSGGFIRARLVGGSSGNALTIAGGIAYVVMPTLFTGLTPGTSYEFRLEWAATAGTTLTLGGYPSAAGDTTWMMAVEV